MASLRVLALNCTLKSARDSEASSTDVLLRQVMDALAAHDAEGEIIRVVDCNIKPGVRADEGAGDQWPALRGKLIAADILVMGTPIWLGQPSSVAKRVLERMDAFLDEKDDRGRMPTYGKVAIAAVVGNEDGAHHCGAELFQALAEVGFTIPSGGVTYWVGEAMGDKDYKDLKVTPKVLRDWTPHAGLQCGASGARVARQRLSWPGTRVGGRFLPP